MNEFEILNLLFTNGKRVRYVDLLNALCQSGCNDMVAAKMRLRELKSKKYIEGTFKSNSYVSLTPAGLLRLDDLRENLEHKPHERDVAQGSSKVVNRHSKRVIFWTAFGAIAAAVSALLTLLYYIGVFG